MFLNEPEMSGWLPDGSLKKFKKTNFKSNNFSKIFEGNLKDCWASLGLNTGSGGPKICQIHNRVIFLFYDIINKDGP